MPTIMIFDTETTSVTEKKFCYNVGYTIFDTDTRAVICTKDYVVEQCWHNNALFATAYYADKRPIYVAAMRSRKATLDKWGYIMRSMAHDIREYKVEAAYAYNSPFDDEVFTFNCDWYKTLNPLDTIPVYDIRGMVSEYVTNTADYRLFCEQYERFTDTGNYSGTAETVYQYLTGNPFFIEEHTALADAIIETEILSHCLDLGAEIGKEYKVMRILPRYNAKPIIIKVDGEVIYKGFYKKKTTSRETVHYKTEV